MFSNGIILVTFCLCPLALTSVSSYVYHDYCVIGAGPGGLQIGYFLHRAGRDYVIFEKANQSGNFFQTYPRHRKLISINKRHTGQKNVEFNLRHDWNSLLSDDESLLMTKYSKEMFPHADDLVRYFNDYTKRLNLNVQYNCEMSKIRAARNATSPDGHVFKMQDQTGQDYMCRTLIVATGLWKPNIPEVPGIEYVQGYEDVSLDPEDYEGKTVLILGRGNAAFEIAGQIYGSTNRIHICGRDRLRIAWETHYVGDLRAVNVALLDTYHLKSLDGVLEIPLSSVRFEKIKDKIYILEVSKFDNQPFREPYDVVIRALGFTFDDSIFNTHLTRVKGFRASKYPAIHHNYESVDKAGLFYAGSATHSLDYRKSAGGFIHGFRYTARALHRLLEWRYENIPWPSRHLPATALFNTIIKRINEASGPYQMTSVLGDVAIFSQDGKSVDYIEDYPVNLMDSLEQRTGLVSKGSVLVITLEYGQNFSFPGSDVFSPERAQTAPLLALKSNFLHPVLYYYKQLPTAVQMASKQKGMALPRPDALHHILEDFLATWDAPESHHVPLRRFLEHIMDSDQRNFFSETCFRLAMTHMSLPESCENQYMKGKGLSGLQYYATHDSNLSHFSSKR